MPEACVCESDTALALKALTDLLKFVWGLAGVWLLIVGAYLALVGTLRGFVRLSWSVGEVVYTVATHLTNLRVPVDPRAG